MDDVTELSQLVLRERQGRDQARWQRVRDAWEPDGRVTISWIDGTADEFILGSIAMSESGLRVTHRMSPPIVDVVADRAVVDAPAIIEVRTMLDGREVDLASRVHLVYRARRNANRWLLHSLTCVYESDVVLLTTPATAELRSTDGAREAYRWLTTVLGGRGHAIADDLPGIDRPDTVSAVEKAHETWLEGRVDA